eukprot:352630-Chlamydomonas_euryale.AAC.7
MVRCRVWANWTNLWVATSTWASIIRTSMTGLLWRRFQVVVGGMRRVYTAQLIGPSARLLWYTDLAVWSTGLPDCFTGPAADWLTGLADWLTGLADWFTPAQSVCGCAGSSRDSALPARAAPGGLPRLSANVLGEEDASLDFLMCQGGCPGGVGTCGEGRLRPWGFLVRQGGCPGGA